MTGKYLADTNLLVYAYDRSEPDKQARALEVLDTLTKNGSGALSPQILAEFYNVVTKKLAKPLTVQEGYASVSNYLLSWEILEVTGQVVLEAIRGVRDHHFSFWDSMVWATARMNQIPAVLSEDFSEGSVIEGVRFINPFRKNLTF